MFDCKLHCTAATDILPVPVVYETWNTGGQYCIIRRGGQYRIIRRAVLPACYTQKSLRMKR